MELLKKIALLVREGLTPADIAREISVSEKWVCDILSANAFSLVE